MPERNVERDTGEAPAASVVRHIAAPLNALAALARAEPFGSVPSEVQVHLGHSATSAQALAMTRRASSPPETVHDVLAPPPSRNALDLPMCASVLEKMYETVHSVNAQ
jgi:hypothetical protein